MCWPILPYFVCCRIRNSIVWNTKKVKRYLVSQIWFCWEGMTYRENTIISRSCNSNPEGKSLLPIYDLGANLYPIKCCLPETKDSSLLLTSWVLSFGHSLDIRNMLLQPCVTAILSPCPLGSSAYWVSTRVAEEEADCNQPCGSQCSPAYWKPSI